MQRFNFSYLSTICFIAISCGLSVAEPTSAASLTFPFRQGGFEEEAVVEGFFVGEDLDQDGRIIDFLGGSGEVTDFRATFSGNSRTPRTTLDFEDLNIIWYELDGGNLGDDIVMLEGIDARPYFVGPGPGLSCDGFSTCGRFEDNSTSEILTVPEPSPFLVSLLALGFIFFAKRANKKKLIL